MIDDDVLNDTPEERDLLLRLAALPQEAEPGRDLWPAIAARLAPEVPATVAVPARSPRRRRFLIQSAAALLLFAAGVAVGRRWEPRPAPFPSPQHYPLAAAVEVQRAGTEYVAALRSLAEGPGSPAARNQGREAALAALYGAAHELVRLDPRDPEATQILKTVSTARSGGLRAVRF